MGNQRQAAQRGRSEVVRETPDGRPEQPFSEHMPGYSVEFDSTGKIPEYSIDAPGGAASAVLWKTSVTCQG